MNLFGCSLTAILATLSLVCDGCKTINFESDETGLTVFTRMTNTSDGSHGRSSYISQFNGSTSYLYFGIENIHAGTGRWIISDKLAATDRAVAFVESWAIEPYLVDSINDGDALVSRWQTSVNNEWIVDSTMAAFCMDDAGDSAVYFESSHLNPTIAGFYVAISEGTEHVPPTYSHIRHDEEFYPSTFMYKMENKWMIGANIGIDSCFSFVEDDALTADAITSTEWRFLNSTNIIPEEASWVIDYSFIISKNIFVDQPEIKISNVYEALREVRAIKAVPPKQKYITLRNSIPMPTMGLGTGGLYEGAETTDTLTSAMKLGYRLFDLAREYNNEKAFAEVIAAGDVDHDIPLRNELFIETKVWPTDLGFLPTTDAIMTSLDHLNSNYIDLYLLHWPFCDPTVEWMHCETTKDPYGTWRESWRALEKAYAEGKVMSIGVSNFNITLLNELTDFAVVKPHAVQNFAEPGKVDDDVRQWCADHGVAYQPYASIRNLHNLPVDLSNALHRIAGEKSVSAHSVAIRFFIQSGSGVIPRSKNHSHLKENLEAFEYELTESEMKELGWTGPFHSEL